MIATIEGKVSEKNAEVAVIDVGGVGYGVFIAAEDSNMLITGEKAKLYIYEYIRENSHDLYGFCQTNTKRLFEQLVDVNGVGPRMALHILSLGNVDDVANAIANEDTAYIQQAHGVGKRVAERVVVDLKDKVGKAGGYTAKLASTQDEAVQGLMALGFTQADAQIALAEVDSKLSTEQRIKQALKGAK